MTAKIATSAHDPERLVRHHRDLIASRERQAAELAAEIESEKARGRGLAQAVADGDASATKAHADLNAGIAALMLRADAVADAITQSRGDLREAEAVVASATAAERRRRAAATRTRLARTLGEADRALARAADAMREGRELIGLLSADDPSAANHAISRFATAVAGAVAHSGLCEHAPTYLPRRTPGNAAPLADLVRQDAPDAAPVEAEAEATVLEDVE